MSGQMHRISSHIAPVLDAAWGRLEPFAHAIPRWVMAAILTIHGAARLRLIDIGGPTIESTARFNAAFNLQPALFWSYYVTSLELIGGLLLLVGLFARPVAALLTAFLFVATVYITPHFGFWSRDGGVEYAALLLAVAISVLIRGAGVFSLDHRWDAGRSSDRQRVRWDAAE